MKMNCVMMGMPIAIDLPDSRAKKWHVDEVIEYFTYIDETFSTYKDTSEISRINQGALSPETASEDVREVFALSEETRQLTRGFFDIRRPTGGYDPSGLVKGLAIHRAAEILRGHGLRDFYVDVGGDIQADGQNADGVAWRIGIRNPFQGSEVIKVLHVSDRGIATSGSYLRGKHIYDPHGEDRPDGEVVSLTVIGPNVFEADRFATAAFAMGRAGIRFIQGLKGFEGYLVDGNGIATMTSGFIKYAG